MELYKFGSLQENKVEQKHIRNSWTISNKFDLIINSIVEYIVIIIKEDDNFQGKCDSLNDSTKKVVHQNK